MSCEDPLPPCPVVTNYLPNERHYTLTGSSLPLKHLTHIGVAYLRGAESTTCREVDTTVISFIWMVPG
jgi:hypothetical protein